MCPVIMAMSSPLLHGPKHTGELWVYIGTPLPNPSGNAGVMVCMYVNFYPVIVFPWIHQIHVPATGHKPLQSHATSLVCRQLSSSCFQHNTHTITPVFPEGLGRGVPMHTHGSPVCFRSHVIGGEPIAINRAQILTPSCY